MGLWVISFLPKYFRFGMENVENKDLMNEEFTKV